MADEIHTAETVRDERLYVPYPEGWEFKVKRGGDREYCYFQAPGEEHFHLLIPGELYLQRGAERYCFNCALRQRVLTHDRAHWQHRSGETPIVPDGATEIGLAD